ncbi:MAG: sugar-binding domain-containing protein, partial [Bacteroidota bacterium]|nr:sugar-binding domain-containing protein [Bacteroidota bacterium]
MKKIRVLAILAFVTTTLTAQWKPAGDKIKTKWASQIDVNNVLPEYPRPIMERDAWQNLNGLWEYSIEKKGAAAPKSFDGKILVPFPVESSLSGVMKEVGADQEVWYKRSFSVPSDWNNKAVLLHFGAVDWETEVWLNGVKIGSHTGGFTPFSFDISPFLKSGKQELTVKVWDPTSDGPQPRGKQVKNPDGIWYTPVTGIWQTVWLEPVSKKHIEDVRTTPDIDQGTIS